MKQRIDATGLMAQFEKPKGYFLGEKDPVLPIDRMQKELQKVEPNSFFTHPQWDTWHTLKHPKMPTCS